MTLDEALKVAEEALDHSHVDDCDCEDCAALAALARLREELPKIVEEMRLCLRVDTKHTLCIKDWLARLEEGE